MKHIFSELQRLEHMRGFFHTKDVKRLVVGDFMSACVTVKSL